MFNQEPMPVVRQKEKENFKPPLMDTTVNHIPEHQFGFCEERSLDPSIAYNSFEHPNIISNWTESAGSS